MRIDKNITRGKEISKVQNMVNKCAVANYTSGYAKGLKKPSLHFPEDVELKIKWIYFVKRKEWTPTSNTVKNGYQLQIQLSP